MKTETQTLEQKINSILSPVRVLSVQDFMMIGKFICIDGQEYLTFKKVLDLIERFESLTRGKWVEEVYVCKTADKSFGVYQDFVDEYKKQTEFKEPPSKVWQPALLTKEMFVCEVKEPDGYDKWVKNGWTCKTIEENEVHLGYLSALQNVWFEHFEIDNGALSYSFLIEDSDLNIAFGNKRLDIGESSVYNPTVFDFIYQIDLFNRTAEKKIPVYYSENFIKELLK